MDLFFLYNKKILSHSGFRLYRLLLDIQTQSGKTTLIKANRQALMKFTGMSENSLKLAIEEILALGLVVIRSERPTLWQINEREKFNETELAKRIGQLTAGNSAETADSKDE